MKIICGGVVEKNGKYLLVQESQPKCYGKWNVPAGHLDPGEIITEGAVREIKEECNCDVELTGICSIDNKRYQDDGLVAFVFATKLLTDDARPQEGEILDVKWFTYDEVLALGDQLREPEWIIHIIKNHREGNIMPLDIIHVIDKTI